MSADRSGGIAYTRAGEGPPLVLIHGLGGVQAIWEPQIDALAAERDVIALDMPGFGASPVLEEISPSPAALAARILEFLAELGVERPHLAGNSLGGWVALEMALQAEIASLCLISPAGLWRRALGPRSFDIRQAARLMRPLILAALRLPRLRARMLRSTVGHPEKISARIAAILIKGWIDAPGYAAAGAEMRSGRFEHPEKIDVPTTIIWGELDRLVGPPKPERRPPNTRFLRIPDFGHTPNWDDPELLAELLLEASSGTRVGISV